MSLAETLAPIWAELSSIKKRLPSVSPATVTSVGPVRIQVDGQTAPVAASPDSLVPVGPGDRVRVLRYGTTHLILGVIGGGMTPWREVTIRPGYTGNSLYGPARYRIEQGRTLVLDVYINKTGGDFAALDEPFAVPVSLPSMRYFLVYGDTNVGRGRLTTDGRMQLFNAISGSYLSTNMARIPLD